MSFVRLRSASLAALPIALLAVLAPAAPAGATTAMQRADGIQVPLLASSSDAVSLVADPAPAGAALVAARTATFQVTYHGFTPSSRASFQRAVDIWSTKVASAVPITIDATFQPLAPGVLGSAGPKNIFRDFVGAPQPGTWYVDTIANKRAGRQLDPGADIIANFSSSFTNWNFAAAPAPKGQYDFQSVVLHELGHGLGFLGAGNVSGGLGSVRQSGLPIAYDRLTENAAGKALLSFPDASTALAAQLTGGNVFFDSPAVRSANAGKTARLYAPSTWRQGSSYSHLDEATYPAGSANSLMTPAIGDGESIRTPGPITRAIFTSIGW